MGKSPKGNKMQMTHSYRHTFHPHRTLATSYLAAVADLPKQVGVQGGELFTNLIGQFFHSINLQQEEGPETRKTWRKWLWFSELGSSQRDPASVSTTQARSNSSLEGGAVLRFCLIKAQCERDRKEWTSLNRPSVLFRSKLMRYFFSPVFCKCADTSSWKCQKQNL